MSNMCCSILGPHSKKMLTVIYEKSGNEQKSKQYKTQQLLETALNRAQASVGCRYDIWSAIRFALKAEITNVAYLRLLGPYKLKLIFFVTYKFSQ